jgi:hypothetical protein
LGAGNLQDLPQIIYSIYKCERITVNARLEMKFKIISIVLTTFFTQLCFAQSFDTLWTKIYHNEFSGLQVKTWGYNAIELSDGSIVAAGLCSDPWVKAYITKTDANGNQIWVKKYLDDVTESFYCTDMKLTNDGGFILCGHGQSTMQPLLGFRLLKLDSNGDYMWDNFYPTASVTDTISTSSTMIVAPDGGFIISGFTGYWHPDSLAYIVGDGVAMKTDASGNLLWYKNYGDPDELETFLDIESGHDGGYWLCGHTRTNEVQGDMIFIKIDEDGNQLDYKTHGFPLAYDEARSIAKTSDGYIVAGVWGDWGTDMALVKLTSSCGFEWIQSYGPIEDAQHGCVACPNPAGGYILAGIKWVDGGGEDYFIVATDAGGNQLWDITFFGDNMYSYPRSVSPTSDGGFIISAVERTAPGVEGLLLIRIGSGATSVEEDIEVNTYYLNQNFPNPFNPSTKISFHIPSQTQVSLKIFDVLGNEIKTLVDEVKNAGLYEYEFNALSLTSGVYFYKIETLEYSETKKMLLLK